MIRTLTIAIFVIAVIAMMTAGQVYAKKNHSAGTRCDFGANHDICNDPGKGKHFESCEDKGGDIGNVCDIITTTVRLINNGGQSVGELANYSFGASSPGLREIFKTSAFSMIANG